MPLSEKLINDLNESEGLLSFVLKNSKPIKQIKKKENLLLLKKNVIYLKKRYIRDEKEDNMLFEEYLKHFRREINENITLQKEYGPVDSLVWEEIDSPGTSR